ncbi:unnamed protein product [Trichogramma brassicae]|uniref:Uncharacterized protein n=1 Tax=Trichogramma brassicae TaxID=86971 RepID=A0A6H5IX86_9HYME|nr:unnamed protein product [Trichogramma brassicae]
MKEVLFVLSLWSSALLPPRNGRARRARAREMLFSLANPFRSLLIRMEQQELFFRRRDFPAKNEQGFKYYAAVEDIYDVLEKAHTGTGGRSSP